MYIYYCTNKMPIPEEMLRESLKIEVLPEWKPQLSSFPRDDVLTALQDKQVLVISGDTGCGKSTQVSWERWGCLVTEN